MAMTVQQATAVVAKVMARGEYGRDDLENYLQQRASLLRDVTKSESIAQSYTRNFVGYGALRPPSDPLGAAVFQALQSGATVQKAVADADKERREAAKLFGSMCDAVQRKHGVDRSTAMNMVMRTPEGAAAWSQYKAA